MIRCPTCGNEDYDGVLFCESCGNRLFSGAPVRTTSFTPAQLRDTGTLLRTSGALVGDAPVRLMMIEGGESIFVPPRDEVVLGRTDPSGEVFPDIDLTPHGAAQKGVSRRHMVLRREDGRIYIADLGTTNGSRLNGVRLSPNEPYPVNDGDEIMLCKLSMRIHLGSDTPHADSPAGTGRIG